MLRHSDDHHLCSRFLDLEERIGVHCRFTDDLDVPLLLQPGFDAQSVNRVIINQKDLDGGLRIHTPTMIRAGRISQAQRYPKPEYGGTGIF